MKRPCLHRPHPPNLRQLGRDPPRAYLGTSRYLDSRSCILQRETVLRNKPQPQSVFARERNACHFLPQPNAPHGAKEGLGCLWLLGHFCLAGGFHSLKTFQMSSPSVRRLIWHAKALFAQAPATDPEPARQRPNGESLSPKLDKSRF